MEHPIEKLAEDFEVRRHLFAWGHRLDTTPCQINLKGWGAVELPSLNSLTKLISGGHLSFVSKGLYEATGR